jgi:hypothetical protein
MASTEIKGNANVLYALDDVEHVQTIVLWDPSGPADVLASLLFPRRYTEQGLVDTKRSFPSLWALNLGIVELSQRSIDALLSTSGLPALRSLTLVFPIAPQQFIALLAHPLFDRLEEFAVQRAGRGGAFNDDVMAELGGRPRPALRSLTLNATAMSADGLSEFCRRGPYPALERLDLGDNVIRARGGIEALFDSMQMPRLAHLKLPRCRLTPALMTRFARGPLAQSVTHLNLFYCTSFDDEVATAVPANLVELWLPYKHKLSIESYRALVERTRTVIGGGALEGQLAKILAAERGDSPTVSFSDLQFEQSVHAAGVVTIAQAAQLKTLSIDGILRSLKDLAHFPNLTRLDLSAAAWAEFVDLRPLLKLPELAELRIDPRGCADPIAVLNALVAREVAVWITRESEAAARYETQAVVSVSRPHGPVVSFASENFRLGVISALISMGALRWPTSRRAARTRLDKLELRTDQLATITRFAPDGGDALYASLYPNQDDFEGAIEGLMIDSLVDLPLLVNVEHVSGSMMVANIDLSPLLNLPALKSVSGMGSNVPAQSKVYAALIERKVRID